MFLLTCAPISGSAPTENVDPRPDTAGITTLEQHAQIGVMVRLSNALTTSGRLFPITWREFTRTDYALIAIMADAAATCDKHKNLDHAHGGDSWMGRLPNARAFRALIEYAVVETGRALTHRTEPDFSYERPIVKRTLEQVLECAEGFNAAICSSDPEEASRFFETQVDEIVNALTRLFESETYAETGQYRWDGR